MNAGRELRGLLLEAGERATVLYGGGIIGVSWTIESVATDHVDLARQISRSTESAHRLLYAAHDKIL